MNVRNMENQTIPQTYTEHTTPPNKGIQTLTKLQQGKDILPPPQKKTPTQHIQKGK
jgi:hypothetical protein